MKTAQPGFDSIVRRHIEEGFFPGAVLRVERDGQVLHEEAWGHSLLTEDERLPMETSTIFDLASVTKLFTTTAALRLVSLGKLALDAPVADLLCGPAGEVGPGVPPLDPGLNQRLRCSLGRVDLEALLSHSSGIHYWYPFYTRRGGGFESVLADVLEAHPRGKEVVYSDLNFMILALIVERAAGLPLRGAMAELVLRPLGLEHSTYAPPLGPSAAGEFGNRIERAMVSALGLSFDSWRDETRPIIGESDDGNCHYFFGGAAGHAGIFSDTSDLCRLGRLYLESGRIDGLPFLTPGLAEDAMRERAGSRGLGFQLGPNYPLGGCGHTGFTGSYLQLRPGRGLVIAILANRLHVGEPRDINPFRRELSEAVLAAFGT